MVATTKTPVTADQWADLGAGPLQVQGTSGPVAFAIADSQPSPSDQGFILGSILSDSRPHVVSTTAHVWAKAINGLATITAAPVAASGGGGGSVTQGTTPWVVSWSGQNIAATQSGSWSVGQTGSWSTSITGTLPAFAAIPAIKIDQTTNGSTNGITLLDGTSATTIARVGNPSTDATATTLPGLYTNSRTYILNGTSWDRAINVNAAAGGTGTGVAAVGIPAVSGAVGPTPTASVGNSSASASAKNLYGYSVVQGAAAGFFVIINASSAPSSGAAITPLDFVYVAAGAIGIVAA